MTLNPKNPIDSQLLRRPFFKDKKEVGATGYQCRFIHKLIQEFCAATYLATIDGSELEQVIGLAPDQREMILFSAHYLIKEADPKKMKKFAVLLTNKMVACFRNNALDKDEIHSRFMQKDIGTDWFWSTSIRFLGTWDSREAWRNLMGVNIVIEVLSLFEQWAKESLEEPITKELRISPEWKYFGNCGKGQNEYLRCLLVLEPAMRYDYVSFVQFMLGQIKKVTNVNVPVEKKLGYALQDRTHFPNRPQHWIHDALDTAVLECDGPSRIMQYLSNDSRFKLKSSLMKCIQNGNHNAIPSQVKLATDREKALTWAKSNQSPVLPVLLKELSKQGFLFVIFSCSVLSDTLSAGRLYNINLKIMDINSGVPNEFSLFPVSQLRSLDIRLDTTQGLTPLSGLTEFHGLVLQDESMVVEDLHIVSALTSLTSLSISYARPRDLDLSFTSSLQNLRYLFLNNISLKDEQLTSLKPLRRLTSLTLNGPLQLTPEGLNYLGSEEFRALQVMSLNTVSHTTWANVYWGKKKAQRDLEASERLNRDQAELELRCQKSLERIQRNIAEAKKKASSQPPPQKLILPPSVEPDSGEPPCRCISEEFYFHPFCDLVPCEKCSLPIKKCARDDHDELCTRRVRKCSFGCDVELDNEALWKHYQTSCPNWIVNCRCTVDLPVANNWDFDDRCSPTRFQYTEDHFKLNHYPLLSWDLVETKKDAYCFLGCGVVYQQEKLWEHLLVCPKYFISFPQCSFFSQTSESCMAHSGHSRCRPEGYTRYFSSPLPLSRPPF